MPKLRVSVDEVQNRKIIAAIRYGSEMKQIEPVKLSEYIGISRTTYYNRLKHPEQFTVRELRRICKTLNLSITQLLEGKLESTENV
jgi:DNA-binding Xre family transcriptional regulator